MISKILLSSEYEQYALGNHCSITGLVYDSQTIEQLDSIKSLYDGLRLDVLPPEAWEDAALIMFGSDAGSEECALKIAYSNEWGGHLNSEKFVYPFSGSGFTSATGGWTIPEWHITPDAPVVLSVNAIARRFRGGEEASLGRMHDEATIPQIQHRLVCGIFVYKGHLVNVDTRDDKYFHAYSWNDEIRENLLIDQKLNARDRYYWGKISIEETGSMTFLYSYPTRLNMEKLGVASYPRVEKMAMYEGKPILIVSGNDEYFFVGHFNSPLPDGFLIDQVENRPMEYWGKIRRDEEHCLSYSHQDWESKDTRPEAERSQDIDRLSQESRGKDDRASMERLWKSVYGLERWVFINRGTGGQPAPYIGVVDDKPLVMVFTDHDKAIAFQQSQGLPGDDPAGIVALSPTDAVSFFHAYKQQGVFGVLFNCGPCGFFSPLDQLVAMKDFFLQ